MSLPARIKEGRKRTGMIQPKFANAVGVSLATVRRWEGGVSTPDGEQIKKIAEILNTTGAYLMGETDNPERGAEGDPKEPEPSTVERQNNGYLIYNDGERHIELPPTPEGYALFEKLLVQKSAVSSAPE